MNATRCQPPIARALVLGASAIFCVLPACSLRCQATAPAIPSSESQAQPDMAQALALHNRGLAEMRQGQLKEARADLENSLNITSRLAPNSEQFASTSSSLGNLRRTQGDLAAAEHYLSDSVTVRRKIAPVSLAMASALNNFGNLHRLQGNFVQAQAEYEEALKLVQQLAPGSSQEAGGLMSLGTLAQSRGDQSLAAEYYERSAVLWKKIEPASMQLAMTLVNLGQVRQDQGKLQEAERLYNQAIAVPGWQKASPISDAGVNRALAELYAAQDRAPEAIIANRKALAILHSVAPGSVAEADVADHLGKLVRTQGDLPGAEEYYRNALAIQQRLVPDTTDIAESLHGLGLVARGQGKNDEAVKFLFRAVDALESQSARLGGSELVNAGFRASYSQFYRDLADMLILVGKNDEAFAVTERYRARSFLDQLAQREISFAGAPKSLTLRLHENASEYEKVQAQIEKLSTTQARPQLDRLQSELVSLGAARAQIIDDIRRQSPAFAALRYPQALAAAGSQAALDPGTVLVSFLVEQQVTYVFVMGPPGSDIPLSVFTVPLGELALRTKIERFRMAIQGSERADQTRLRQQAKELYELLLRPAEGRLSPSERLLILPDGPLYALPFSALMRGGTFLAEWKPVSTTLSVTLFAELKKQRRNPSTYSTSLVAFGNAIYGQSQQSGGGAAQRRAPSAVAAQDLSPLTFSKPETERIAQLFLGHSKVYEAATATEENAKAIGPDVRYIHFAVHGKFDEVHPLDSWLAFSQPRPSQASHDNGYLQAWELYQDARWDADLVVLSACESALGKEFAGEGLIGLTRAVHYAGARSVISSLWNVDDRRTALLMTALYTNLKSGQSKDEALRAAQLQLLHSRSGAAPFYWAAFTLQGDWK